MRWTNFRSNTILNIIQHSQNPREVKNWIIITETYSKARVGKYLSHMFPIRSGLKQGDALSPLIFNFALEYAIRRIQANQEDLKLNGTHQLLVYADGVNILGGRTHAIKKNTQAFGIR